MSPALLFPDHPDTLPDDEKATCHPATRCPTCGHTIVTAADATGTVRHLDTAVATWLLDWTKGTDAPRAMLSRAYPEHPCVTTVIHSSL